MGTGQGTPSSNQILKEKDPARPFHSGHRTRRHPDPVQAPPLSMGVPGLPSLPPGVSPGDAGPGVPALCCISRKVPMFGLEAIWRDGQAVGHIRRADFGFTIDKTLAYGYIRDPSGGPVSAVLGPCRGSPGVYRGPRATSGAVLLRWLRPVQARGALSHRARHPRPWPGSHLPAPLQSSHTNSCLFSCFHPVLSCQERGVPQLPEQSPPDTLQGTQPWV